MEKLLVNEYTLKLAQNQVILSYKDAYLSIQHCLLTFLKDARGKEKKEDLRRQIKEVEEVYRKTMERLNSVVSKKRSCQSYSQLSLLTRIDDTDKIK